MASKPPLNADAHTARTLHVIDPCAAGPMAVAALAAVAKPEDTTIIVGPTRAGDMAAAAGVRIDARVGAPLGITELAWRGARARAKPRLSRFAWTLAWSPGAAAMARLAFPGAPIGACVLHADAGSRDSLWSFRRSVVRSLADAAVFGSREHAASWGSLGGRVATPPAPAAATMDAAARAAARARWGFSDDAPIVALLGDPPLPLDARRAMFLVGALAIAGTPVHGVAPHDATGVERARRLIERQRGPWSVGLEDRPPNHWIGACDAAIAFANRDGSTPIAALWSLRAGTPTIVEDRSATGASWREDGALMVPRGAVNTTASRLLDIIERRPVATDSGGAPGSPPDAEDTLRNWRSEVNAALRSAAGRASVARATSGGPPGSGRLVSVAGMLWSAREARSSA